MKFLYRSIQSWRGPVPNWAIISEEWAQSSPCLGTGRSDLPTNDVWREKHRYTVYSICGILDHIIRYWCYYIVQTTRIENCLPIS